MRASIHDRYGPPEVLEVRDVPPPSLRAGHVRVEVHAAGLNPKDVLVRAGRMRWLVGRGLPRIPGYDVAGLLVDPLGPWPPGTPVFGMIQDHRGGGCAEVASLRVDEVARDHLSPTPAARSRLVESAMVRSVVTQCHHRVLDQLPPPPAKLRCTVCHLTLSAEELGGGWCPECAETRGERNDEFEAVAPATETGTRYRCEECGLVVEAQPSS